MTFIDISCIITITYQVTIAMIITSTAASGHRFNKIMETCPTDADTIRTFHYVEITINAILYITVIHPHVLGTYQADVVTIVSINIIGTRSFQSQIAYNDIPTAFQKEYSSFFATVQVTDGGTLKTYN